MKSIALLLCCAVPGVLAVEYIVNSVVKFEEALAAVAAGGTRLGWIYHEFIGV